MTDVITIVGSLLGGLGLFLLAIGMMTDGLRESAGSSLRKILAESTNTPIRGLFSGFFMTALVQSSSAVTVASIGFVNAGLLTMRQALGLIYGANIGTTITGWLVAFIGFKLNIQAFALPLIGIGMIIHLIKHPGRVAAFGLALVGFGLFFVGIDILKNTFESLITTFDLSQITADGIAGIFIFLLVGIGMTVLTQSSSAAIALTITAAITGIVGIYAAAAMVIGANVGTTSTAVLASIGATANAKRVALAQVLFNVGTGIVALMVLPLMFLIINGLSQFFAVSAEPGITLALFHTSFNILGVILIFPLNNRLASFLEKRFVSRDLETSLPKYLDKTLSATPVLAVNALVMELDSIEQRVNSLAMQSAQFKSSVSPQEVLKVKQLLSAISKFISTLEQKEFSSETTNHLATLLRIEQYFLSCVACISSIDERRLKLINFNNQSVTHELESFQNEIIKILAKDASSDIDKLQLVIQHKHDSVKTMILNESAERRLNFEIMLEFIDLLGDLLKMTLLWLKAIKCLQRLVVDTKVTIPNLNELNIQDETSH